MKLTENNLRELVKEVLKEDRKPFPPPPDEETVEDAIEMDKHSTGPIIRFYESDEKEDDDPEHISKKDDLEGLAARAMAAVHDLADAAGADISTTVDTCNEVDEGCKDDREIIVGEEDVQESLSLDDIVQEEIAKYVEVKKKIISP